MNDDIYYLSIDELQHRLRARDVSPTHVVERCLERIDRMNTRLNAFATVLADHALDQAREADEELQRGRWRGPLHGVPVGIKDFYDTAGIATTAAFEPFRNRVPRVDAESVERLKTAGAVIVGKMNMHSLGMGTTGLDSLFGPVRNPWNDRYISGGSSSGSAAAVSAGLCFATLDTDAIGSCRLPAACCGVAGFKGTYGLLSTKGILEGEPADESIRWYAHPGITTRSVADTFILVRALAEPQRLAALARSEQHASGKKALRLGVAENARTDMDVARVFAAAIESLRVFGHHIVSTTAPFDIPGFDDLRTIEADRRRISGRAFQDIDVLVLPTLPERVPDVDQARGNPRALSAAFTIFANYFGLPAISVPCGFDDNGLPVGLQFVGRPWDDAVVLGLADRFVANSRFFQRQPMP